MAESWPGLVSCCLVVGSAGVVSCVWFWDALSGSVSGGGVGEVLEDFVGEGSDVVDPGFDFGAVPDGEFDGVAVPGEVIVPGRFGDVSCEVPSLGGLEVAAECVGDVREGPEKRRARLLPAVPGETVVRG